ncbi:MAG: glycoside hydrolase family 127 protein [Deltaproteobacteria bacterium]|nr:glycoside hydrolase family 127 protein [Deltaproteobacteria bacterium]
MLIRALLPLLGVVLSLCAAPAHAAFAPVAITVAEPDGIERAHWPLTVSVPLPRGALQAASQAHVTDDRGTALPTQARALAAWPDGSVRWLLVDTQVELRPRQTRQLQLRAGPPPPVAAPVQVQEEGERIVVDTGALRFFVPRHHFAIVEGLAAPGKAQPVLGPLRATLEAGERVGGAEPPRSIEILERGPLRTRIALRGSYGNAFDYVIRVDAYAGQRFVRVLHTFINRHAAAFVSLKRITLDLPIAELKPGDYHYGVVGERPRSGDLDDTGLHVLQLDNTHARIGDADAELQLAGWLELTSSRGVVGVASRWFWQEYPQSLAATRAALTMNLWAPETEPAKAGVGAAKTHELTLWLAPPRGLPPHVGAALTRPLVGVVDPTWIATSGALPQAIAPRGATQEFARKAGEAAQRYLTRNAQERWNDCGEVECTTPGLARPRVGAFGMWNWGDWNFRGYEDRTKGTDSWGNLEYDTTQVLALSAAVSGDPDLYDATLAAARHAADVDVIHAYPTRPEWVGMNHPKNPLHFSFQLGGPDLGHTWTEGLVSAYWLTGDERLLEAARGIADYLVARSQGVVRGNPRQWGWPQIALLAVYQATGEADYVKAARSYAERGMAAHPASAPKQFKLALLGDALAYLHALTGDPAARAWLEQYAAAIMQPGGNDDARAFAPVAYVADLTGDAAMRAAALQRLDRLDLGSWGKPFSVNGRLGFRIASLLSEPAPAAASATPAAKQRRREHGTTTH